MNAFADVAVIGGSGLYALPGQAETHKTDTPYGDPSDELTIALVGETRVAFLPGYGKDRRCSPHQIPCRANMWALRRRVGVRPILAACAVGALCPDLEGNQASPKKCSGSSAKTPSGCARLLVDAVQQLPAERGWACGPALDGLQLPIQLPN